MGNKSDMGIVYVLTNLAMPGFVKIGITKDLEGRLHKLYTTNIPFPFSCIKASKIKNCKEVERKIHDAFRNFRPNPRREFFEIEPES